MKTAVRTSTIIFVMKIMVEVLNMFAAIKEIKQSHPRTSKPLDPFSEKYIKETDQKDR
jgi:hypothetical protein